MRDRFTQNRSVIALAMRLALMLAVWGLPAAAQSPDRQRSETGPTDRELQVKELRSGGALDGRGKLWAVVIGVSNYKNLTAKDQLEFAHRDASEFAAFLRSPNGGAFPSNQLTLLTNQAATLSAMRSALGTTLPRSVEPDDLVIIFFAGHGVVEGENDGYLLAHDSDPQNLYATALQISELNRIISERLKARSVILITDACHSGRLGWAARGSGESRSLVNRYLDEVGKSGKGVFRLLASRADQLSYEDKRFGGGHGCFTWYLLEGLRGKADRDTDGVVRIGELLDYLSEQVPKATQSLQHPRAAGDIDVRLPLSVLSNRSTKITENAAVMTREVTLEVRSLPGLEVYLDQVFRGRVLPSGALVIEQLKPGEHDLALLSPNIEPISQKVSLSAAKTVLDVKAPAASSPLVAPIKHAIGSNDIRTAIDLYKQLIKQSPQDPQRAAIESSLSGALESIGQNAINVYVQSSGTGVKRGMFQNAAEAFRLLMLIQPVIDQSVEAKYLFCNGRAKIEELRFEEAVDQLNRAVVLDPRAAYAYNALGLAYREMKKNDRALAVLKRSRELAPAWVLPLIQIGLIYLTQGMINEATESLKEAAQLDPRHYLPHEQLSLLYLKDNRLKEAEQEAETAVSLEPNSGISHLVLGQTYEHDKRWAPAANAYEKGLKLMTNLNEIQREEFTRRLEKCRKKAR